MVNTAITFDLRGLIRKVYGSVDVCDVNVLAKEVSRLTSDDDLREAYEQALPSLVQNTISRDRNSSLRDTPGNHAGVSSAPVVPAQRGSVVPPNKSWKVQAYRKYAAELQKFYASGFAPGSHKPLGKFTVDDCRAAEAMCRKLAAGNINSAERWDRFAQSLAKHNAATVAQLPDAVLDGIFGGVR